MRETLSMSYCNKHSHEINVSVLSELKHHVDISCLHTQKNDTLALNYGENLKCSIHIKIMINYA
jgi:hypothetical protein